MAKRIQILHSYEEEDPDSFGGEGDILNEANLIKLKKFAQTEPGIEQLDEAGYIEKLAPLLDEKYANTRKQAHATHIIGNLFFAPHHTPPSPTLVNNILSILQGDDLESIENCLNILSNVMFDNRDWRNRVIFELDLAGRLNRLFDLQGTSE